MGTQEDNTILFFICYYCVYGGVTSAITQYALPDWGAVPIWPMKSDVCLTLMSQPPSWLGLSSKLLYLTKSLTMGPRGQSHLSIPEPPIHRCAWGPTMTWKAFHFWNHSTKLVGANSRTCPQTAARGCMKRGKTRSHDPRTSRTLSKTSHVSGVTWRQPRQGLLWSLSCGHGEGAGLILTILLGQFIHSLTPGESPVKIKERPTQAQIRETQRVPKRSGLRI